MVTSTGLTKKAPREVTPFHKAPTKNTIWISDKIWSNFAPEMFLSNAFPKKNAVENTIADEFLQVTLNILSVKSSV